jgi:hypothetical protein
MLNFVEEVRFEVLTAVIMNITIFWDTAQCSPYVNRPPAARWFLARLIFDTEDGGHMSLRNVGLHTDNRTLYKKRW